MRFQDIVLDEKEYAQMFELVGALTGLVRITQIHPKEETTTKVILQGLKRLAILEKHHITQMRITTEMVREERKRLAPDCGICKYPCENAKEYDFAELFSERKEIVTLKLNLLDALCQKANVLAYENLDAKTEDLIYRALFAVAYPFEEEEINELLEKVIMSK